MPQHPLLLAGVGLAALASLLQVVSVATPKWLSVDVLIASVSAGLWKMCGSALGTEDCNSLDTVTGAMQAVRAMSILAVLLLAAAAGVGALVAVNSSLVHLLLLAPAIALAGEIFAVLGFSIFAAKKLDMYDLPQSQGIDFGVGYSFGLSVAAAVISGFSVTCFILARRRILYSQIGS